MDWYWILLIALGGLILLILLICLIGAIYLINANLKRLPSYKDTHPKNDYWDNVYKRADITRDRFKELNPETLELKCKDGFIRRALFYKNELSDTLIVFSHGWQTPGFRNFGFVGNFALNNNFSILIVDHMGHDLSEGKYLGFGAKDYEPLIEWCEYVNTLFKDKKNIYLHGVSMGGNAVLLTADKELPSNVKGIIDDCGFTSAWEEFCFLMKENYHLPPRPIIDFVYIICKLFLKMDIKKNNSKNCVKNSKVPIFYIHGDIDRFVPTFMTFENEKLTNIKHEMWISENTLHAATSHNYPEEYERRIVNFINNNK